MAPSLRPDPPFVRLRPISVLSSMKLRLSRRRHVVLDRVRHWAALPRTPVTCAQQSSHARRARETQKHDCIVRISNGRNLSCFDALDPKLETPHGRSIRAFKTPEAHVTFMYGYMTAEFSVQPRQRIRSLFATRACSRMSANRLLEILHGNILWFSVENAMPTFPFLIV